MKSKEIVSNILNGILVMCALLITALVVRRELFLSPQGKKMETIAHWQMLLNEGGHLRGSAKAPLKIIEFTDFECPYCKTLEGSLDTVLDSHKGKVALISYEFPLNIHPYAYKAAIAAECAGQFGYFDEYCKLLYDRQSSFDSNPWREIAQLVGIKKLSSFDRCIADTESKSTIERDIQIGKGVGVDGTPTLIINGRMVSGALTSNQLEYLIKKFSRE